MIRSGIKGIFGICCISLASPRAKRIMYHLIFISWLSAFSIGFRSIFLELRYVMCFGMWNSSRSLMEFFYVLTSYYF